MTKSQQNREHEHHYQAALHFELAAKYHRTAAEQHESAEHGHHGHHAHIAQGHAQHAMHHAQEASKAYATHHMEKNHVGG